METAPAQPDYVFTLIHGTFARLAPWAHNNESFLRRQLAERLAPATVAFEPFAWSGRNSHAARLAGGLALRRTLRERVRRHPAARHVLVAHSHGGNVAVYGLRGFPGVDRVAGLVSLGTPFIACTPHHLPEVAALWRRCTGLVFLLLALLTPLWTALEALPATTPAVAAWLALQATCWLVCRYLFSPAGPVVRRWTRIQAKLARRLVVTDTIPVPCLCVWTTRDEARYVLTLADAVPRLVGAGIGTARLASLVLFLLVLVGGPVGIVWYYRTTDDTLERLIVTALMVGGWLVGSVVLLVALLAVRAAGPAVRAVTSWVFRLGGYGGGLGTGAFSLLAVTQCLQPTGLQSPTVKCFNLRARLRDWFRLQHSLLYDSPDVLASIADWLRRPRDPLPPAGAAGPGPSAAVSQ